MYGITFCVVLSRVNLCSVIRLLVVSGVNVHNTIPSDCFISI